MNKNGALAGIKVLDLSRLLPGPYCSMVLADHGAAVIAVEDRRFLADGLFLNNVNRNKRHMTLNLKSKEGMEIFFRLAKEADVVLEGFRPGVVDKLGVGYDAVCKVNPKIIYCSITGFGQNGPFRERVGHDANYLSFAGVLDLIGEAKRPPSIPGVQIADIAGGGMNAVIGILLALFARENTGKGQYIDISMTDGVVGMLPLVQFFQNLTGKAPARGNALLSHRYACYNTYETADGRYLSIGAVEHRFWKQLCELLGLPNIQPCSMMNPAGKRSSILCGRPSNKRHWMNGTGSWGIRTSAGDAFRTWMRCCTIRCSGNGKWCLKSKTRPATMPWPWGFRSSSVIPRGRYAPPRMGSGKARPIFCKSWDIQKKK